MNGALNAPELPVTGGGVTDADGVVMGTFGPRSDPSTSTAPINSTSGTAMPTANAAIRLFLDFPARY